MSLHAVTKGITFSADTSILRVTTSPSRYVKSTESMQIEPGLSYLTFFLLLHGKARMNSATTFARRGPRHHTEVPPPRPLPH